MAKCSRGTWAALNIPSILLYLLLFFDNWLHFTKLLSWNNSQQWWLSMQYFFWKYFFCASQRFFVFPRAAPCSTSDQFLFILLEWHKKPMTVWRTNMEHQGVDNDLPVRMHSMVSVCCCCLFRSFFPLSSQRDALDPAARVYFFAHVECRSCSHPHASPTRWVRKYLSYSPHTYTNLSHTPSLLSHFPVAVKQVK